MENDMDHAGGIGFLECCGGRNEIQFHGQIEIRKAATEWNLKRSGILWQGGGGKKSDIFPSMARQRQTERGMVVSTVQARGLAPQR
jgi:hypothetical protein